jgi:methyltransferase (TIGR00027 family)
MSESDPLFRSISDTARWVAVYRARESDRPDALFRDRLARQLAGRRGEELAAAMSHTHRAEWTWATRTYLVDQFITEQVAQGVDMVVNLAAGLDARPYRMELPGSLQWIEVDLPELLAEKEGILANETPRCALERIPLDLADQSARRAIFEQLGRRAHKVLILSEGFLVYLTADQVGALAADLAGPSSFQRWVIDLISPPLLRILKRQLEPRLGPSGASLSFGPEEGPKYFIRYGWHPVRVKSLLQAAAQLNRLSFWMRLLAKLPDSKGEKSSRPWGGCCLLARGTTE